MLPGQRVSSSPTTSEPLPLPTPALDRVVVAVKQTLQRLATLTAEFGLEPVVQHVNTDLMPAVLAWASGSSFEQSWLLSPSIYEGTLVRNLKALDEMLQQLAGAADALGNSFLHARFEECVKRVHRGIAFANSLYIA